MTYIIQYEMSEAEYDEEIAILAEDPGWVADHAPETPEEFVADWAPSYVVIDKHGPSLLGTDAPLLSGVTQFDTEAEALQWIASNQGPAYPGTFEVIEV